MMDITFDYYVEDDFSELKCMIFGLDDEDPSKLPISEDNIIRTTNESISNPERIQIFIMRTSAVSIGYGIITFSWSNEYGGEIIHIDEMYIKEEYRNMCIGSHFIRHILELYKNAVLCTLEVTPENKNALRFYERLGFNLSANMHMLKIINR